MADTGTGTIDQMDRDQASIGNDDVEYCRRKKSSFCVEKEKAEARTSTASVKEILTVKKLYRTRTIACSTKYMTFRILPLKQFDTGAPPHLCA